MDCENLAQNEQGLVSTKASSFFSSAPCVRKDYTEGMPLKVLFCSHLLYILHLLADNFSAFSPAL